MFVWLFMAGFVTHAKFKFVNEVDLVEHWTCSKLLIARIPALKAHPVNAEFKISTNFIYPENTLTNFSITFD